MNKLLFNVVRFILTYSWFCFASWFSCTFSFTSFKKTTFKGLISNKGHISGELWLTPPLSPLLRRDRELEIAYMSFYAAYGVIMELDKKKKSRRKIWTREWLLKRNERGAYNGIENELRLTDKEDFRKYLRMNISTFEAK